MGQPLSTAKPAVALSLLWGGAGPGAVLLAVALGLWLHYGTTVFFETIAAGFASCF